MTEYLIESNICFLVFYLAFVLVFKKSRSFQTNRIILLFSVIFSLVIPFISIQTSSVLIPEVEKAEPLIQLLSVSDYVENGDVAVSEIFINNSILSKALITIYALITIGLLIRFIIRLAGLYRQINKAEVLLYKSFQVAVLKQNIRPFTFFNHIFISKKDFEENLIEEEILTHETAHKDQLHSIDVVFMELLLIFLWFNPFIYLFKKFIKVNHEFLADDFVLRSGASGIDYSNKLLYYTYPDKMSGLVSGFSHVIIKQRLIMLSGFRKKRGLNYQFLLLLPIAFLLFFSTAFKSNYDTLTALNPVGIESSSDLKRNEGTFIADEVYWSPDNQKVYFRGKEVVMKFNENDFSGKGSFSILGKVYHLVINNKTVSPSVNVNVSGQKCKLVKLEKAAALRKYGIIGEYGTIEITIEK